MEWISVEKELPNNEEEVLALVDSYYYSSKDPLCQKRSSKIFQATFNRCTGWKSEFAPHPYYINYWMPLPKPPKE